ncbi:hypothetical protein BHQ17_24860 [Mycolicibacterium holsaticum]|uniref:RecBCD enzyme subunit RecD N-terminal domain-containing protein n=1 Tax=Mycolicibacterium holsaticum TaxID=152142 RepID=A0A1E3R5L5_9MYCO|nr:hypothetical protein BHQ17_24860 [Mycolicibacterium holsaticum]
MTSVTWRRAIGATGLLRTFTDAELIESADVHVAQRLTTLAEEPDEQVALAIALLVRALRGGSVCLDLASAEAQVEVKGLGDAVRASTLIGARMRAMSSRAEYGLVT